MVGLVWFCVSNTEKCSFYNQMIGKMLVVAYEKLIACTDTIFSFQVTVAGTAGLIMSLSNDYGAR